MVVLLPGQEMGETTPIRTVRNDSILLILVVPNSLSKPKGSEHYIPGGEKMNDVELLFATYQIIKAAFSWI